MSAHKDTFYRFNDNPDVNWRKAMWRISLQLWNKIRVRTDHKTEDVCLILDDTDHKKTGRMIEKIGRVHSHLRHKAVLGFKCLAMAVTDGVGLKASKDATPEPTFFMKRGLIFAGVK